MRQRTTITVDDFLWRRLKACVALEADVEGLLQGRLPHPPAASGHRRRLGAGGLPGDADCIPMAVRAPRHATPRPPSPSGRSPSTQRRGPPPTRVVWASGLRGGTALRRLDERLEISEGLQGAIEFVNAILDEG
jgi:hypothetical protein